MTIDPATTESASTYRLERLAPHHIDQVSYLLAMTFTESEPMHSSLKTPAPEFFNYARAYVSHAAHNGMGVVAVEGPSDMVVGAVCSEDYVKGMVEGVPNGVNMDKLTCLKTVLTLLDELHVIYLKQLDRKWSEFFQPEYYGTILHNLMACVYPNLRSRGMMNEMMNFHLEDMKKLGFTQAVAECTGRYSQRSLERHGYETRVSIDYETYEVERDGVVVRPFSGLIKEPHKSCNLMWKYKL